MNNYNKFYDFKREAMQILARYQQETPEYFTKYIKDFFTKEIQERFTQYGCNRGTISRAIEREYEQMKLELDKNTNQRYGEKYEIVFGTLNNIGKYIENGEENDKNKMEQHISSISTTNGKSVEKLLQALKQHVGSVIRASNYCVYDADLETARKLNIVNHELQVIVNRIGASQDVQNSFVATLDQIDSECVQQIMDRYEQYIMLASKTPNSQFVDGLKVDIPYLEQQELALEVQEKNEKEKQEQKKSPIALPDNVIE